MIDRGKFDETFDKWAEVARENGVVLGPLYRAEILKQIQALEVAEPAERFQPINPGERIHVRWAEADEDGTPQPWMSGALVSLTVAGFWWAPEYEDCVEFVQWREVRDLKARVEEKP